MLSAPCLEKPHLEKKKKKKKCPWIFWILSTCSSYETSTGTIEKESRAFLMRNLLPESHLAAPSTVGWFGHSELGWKFKPVPPEQAPRAVQLLPIPILVPGEQQESSQDPPNPSTMWLFDPRLL